jgi:hypothetical protein
MSNFFALLFDLFFWPVQVWLEKKSHASDERKAQLQKVADALKPKEPTVR